MSEKITPKQEVFVNEVIKGKSLSDAYRTAYATGNMTDKSVHEAASKLAKKPKVAPRIKDLQDKAAEISVIEASSVMREINRLAMSDIAGIMTADGRVKLPHELDEATRAAVASFKVDEYGRIEYKFWDKNAALEKCAKIKGLYKEDNEQNAPKVFSTIELVGVRPKGALKE